MAALLDSVPLSDDGKQRAELYEGGELWIIDNETGKEIKLLAQGSVSLQVLLSNWRITLFEAQNAKRKNEKRDLST